VRGKYPPTDGSGDGDDPNDPDDDRHCRPQQHRLHQRRPRGDDSHAAVKALTWTTTGDDHNKNDRTNERPRNSAANDKNVMTLAASAGAGQSSSDLRR